MRSLSLIGHDVRWTGRLWSASEFPDDEADRERIVTAVGAELGGVDWVLVMRPSTLDLEMLMTLRRSADARWAVWHSDDPVFFESLSVHVAQEYDLNLHAGDERVLELYERVLGVRGWSFPFWVDPDVFPRVHRLDPPDWPLVFVGNAHTPVKRWRYDALSALDGKVCVVGNAWPDPAGLSVGRTTEPAAAVTFVSRSGAALNFHQRMSDYRGTRYWSARMEGCGEFTFPSRLAQYASWGVPTFTVTTDPATAACVELLLPGIEVVPDAEEALRRYRDEVVTTRTKRAQDAYAALHARHTSTVRARFLDILLHGGEHLSSGSARERSLAFLI